MVDGIGGGTSLGKEAIEAALRRIQARGRELAGETPAQAGQQSPFTGALAQSIEGMNASVNRTDSMPVQALRGELDFHEVTAQLKESELSFEFAMQVRNKLIDAYREVMRMNV